MLFSGSLQLIRKKMSGICFALLILQSVICLGSSQPKISFSYSDEFNPACDVPIKKSWIDEVVQNQHQFTEIWNLESPALFNFFFSKYRNTFSKSKIILAKLSICPSIVSYSRPLVLNVSRFLKSYAGADKVNPDHAFVVLAFHELMHNWVDENLKKSAMLEKYSNENYDVKVHLHLMAIEKYVYSSLGRKDLLGWIEKKYPSIGGDYARAWHIVSEEGCESFLDEFLL